MKPYSRIAIVFSLICQLGSVQFNPKARKSIKWLENKGFVKVDWKSRVATFEG